MVKAINNIVKILFFINSSKNNDYFYQNFVFGILFTIQVKTLLF